MKSKVVKGTIILTGGVLLSKAIGAFYRIPLSNILGAEGVGMYQLVFSVYALIVTVLGSGLPIAISRLTAENIAEGISPKKMLGVALFIGLGLGAVLSVAVFLLAEILAIGQGNEVVAIGYKVISPAIFFVSGLTVLKGYFQGKVNMLPTSLSYIVEQVFKLVIGIVLAYFWIGKGVIYAVIGSLIGVMIAELISFLMLIGIYLFNKETAKLPDPKSFSKSCNNLLKIAIPITIGSTLIPLSQFLDSFIVVNILSKSLANTDATALYGLFSGSVNPIVNMPIMLVLSLAMVIVPVVSKDRLRRNYEGILYKSKVAIKCAIIFGIPCSILLYIYADPLLSLFYPRFTAYEIDTASMLLRIATFSIVFYGIMQIETSLMQGLDRIYIPVINILIALIIKEVLCVVLVGVIGIRGLAYATLVLSVIACLLNGISYRKLLGERFEITAPLLKTIAINFVFFALCIIFKNIIFDDITSFLVACFVGGSIYYILIKNNNVLDTDEWKSLGVSFNKKVDLTKAFYRSNYDYDYRGR